jgi:hypothetical protein
VLEKHDDEFRTFVEAKITEYDCESFNAENDPLDNAFKEHEVLVVFSKLPNGKASGPDGLTYEHIKYAGITLSPKFPRCFVCIFVLHYIRVAVGFAINYWCH